MNRPAARVPRWPQTTLLLAASCLPILAAVLIAPLLPRIQEHFAGEAKVSVLVPVMLTVPGLMVGLFGPLAGGVADFFGRKRLLVAALLAYGVVGVAPLWLESLPAIVGSRVLLGLAEAVIITCCTTLVGDYYAGVGRERVLSMQAMVSSASAAIFFVAGGVLGDIGWRVPFGLYAVALVLAGVAMIVLFEPERDVRRMAVSAAAPSFPWRALRPVFAVTLFGAIVFYVAVVQTSFVLEDLHIRSSQLVGQAIGAAQLAVLLSAFTYRWLSRFGVARLLSASFGLSGLGLLMLSRADSYPSAALALVINGLGGGLLLPTLANWALSLLDFAHRGRGSGSFMACFYVGQFVSPLAVLVLMSQVGGRAAAIGWIAVVTLVAAVVAIMRSRARIAANTVSRG